MQLDLGTKIRCLRQRDGRTQEALAQALGVTSQAVSRWESGGSYPDMSLIPPIANYFGISIDELFGYSNRREERVDALCRQIMDMKRENRGLDRNIDQCIELARSGLLEFPGNERLMLCLASVLYHAGYVRYGEEHLTDPEGYSIYNVERHRSYAEWKEALPLYEKVLETLPEGSERRRAVDELSQLYLNLGMHEKGAALAENAPEMWCSREFLQAFACDGKEHAAALGRLLLYLVHSAAALTVHCTMAYQNNISPAEKVESIRSAIRLFELVCSDGNYGSENAQLSRLHLLLSAYLWLDGQRDEAFGALDKALEHFRKFEDVCREQKPMYTAPLLKLVSVDLSREHIPDPAAPETTAASLPEDWPWWSIPEQEQIKKEMQADPRWWEWIEKIKQ